MADADPEHFLRLVLVCIRDFALLVCRHLVSAGRRDLDPYQVSHGANGANIERIAPLMRIWIALGIPASASMVILFWPMVSKYGTMRILIWRCPPPPLTCSRTDRVFLSRYPSPTGTCLKIRHYLVLLTALLAAPLPALAAEELVEEVVVWGRAIDLMGTADSASQGVVGYADFSTRPIMRVGELVEVVPGMIATQHSGPGKANQYFLRGMNLDHGSDFSARFDGMPVNMRSHAHATGYLDLNFMFPEIIETVEYRKGPYYADVGDFSAAGGAAFKTYDRLDQNFAEFQAGTEDDYRFVGGYGHDLGGGDLIFAVEYFVRDGPWVLEQDLNKVNALVKYTRKYPDFDVRLSALAYDAEWN